MTTTIATAEPVVEYIPATATAWTPKEKLIFRFIFAYMGIELLVLTVSYWLPRFDAIELKPWYLWIRSWGYHLITQPSYWVAGKLFNACGNGMYLCELAEMLWVLAGSIVIAIVWTQLERNRSVDYDKLHRWLRTGLRYFLAYIMWGYAYDKFIGLQFGVGPEAEALLVPLGQWSPMQLMWNSMGYAPFYGNFTGVGEMIAAVPLLWRRTTTFGALMVIVIMLNVTMLDLVHRVNIWGNAFRYMTMGMVLVAPDIRRLWNLYIANRPVQRAVREPSVLTTRWRPLIKTLVVLYFIGHEVDMLAESGGDWWHKKSMPPLAGFYTVERFVADGHTIRPTIGDSTRWQRIAVGLGASGTGPRRRNYEDGSLEIRTMDGTWRPFTLETDTTQHHLTLRKGAPPSKYAKELKQDTALGPIVGGMRYDVPDSTHLHMSGTLDGRSLDIVLRRLDDRNSVLRGGTGSMKESSS